ncbi:MAG TPA: GNAT family N-acetyltransferase [Microbacterium sp.]|nr:GNAT family N-acetyltransferase [Microbacterium sp.]
MTNTLEAEAEYRLANNEALVAAMREEAHVDSSSDFELTVINDAERGRWTAVLGAEAIAELNYRYVGGRVVLLYAWVDHTYRNHGVASELIAYALDEISRSGQKITIICPVVGSFVANHPEFADLIDKVHPGSGAYPRPGATGHDEQELATFENDVR